MSGVRVGLLYPTVRGVVGTLCPLWFSMVVTLPFGGSVGLFPWVRGCGELWFFIGVMGLFSLMPVLFPLLAGCWVLVLVIPILYPRWFVVVG